jgi:hypothetical protein
MNPLFRRGTSLTKAVDRLAELIEQREENGSTWQRAVEAVCKKAERATPEEVKQAQERMAKMMLEIPLPLASLFALGSGTLIERGADVEIPAKAIFERTHEALILATHFGKACLEQAKKHHAEDHQKDDSGNEDNELDIEACIEEYGSSLARQMREEAGGWQALDFLSTAALAIVTRSSHQRTIVRSNTEFMKALQECPADSTLHCLRVALNLLENEKIIVLHPELHRGYHIRINNLGLNFELHTLLADALIGDPAQGWLPGQRPDPRVVAAAKDGPVPMPGDRRSKNFPPAEGAFNLWNWRGLQPDGRLPDGYGHSKHWIWNEGQPADIELFEGTRIILLGPPPYHRTWNAGRFFPHINSELEVLEKLPEEQVRQWLTRITAAPTT